MKIQLDTDNKKIKLESDVKISKLLDTLKKLLPNGEYREFTLETNTVIQYWSSPVIIHDRYPTPYWQPWITYGINSSNYKAENLGVALNNTNNLKANSVNADYSLKSGVFNIEA